MFGLQQMIQEMLKQNGVDIEEVKKASVDGYLQVIAFVHGSQEFQASVSNILKMTLDMQRMNAAKLDAIMAKLGIELNEEKTDGQSRIEFKQ